MPSLVQIMTSCLIGTKPVSESLLPYCHLDPKEHISVKFYQKFIKVFIHGNVHENVVCVMGAISSRAQCAKPSLWLVKFKWEYENIHILEVTPNMNVKLNYMFMKHQWYIISILWNISNSKYQQLHKCNRHFILHTAIIVFLSLVKWVRFLICNR